jgi:hypothetical protein
MGLNDQRLHCDVIHWHGMNACANFERHDHGAPTPSQLLLQGVQPHRKLFFASNGYALHSKDIFLQLLPLLIPERKYYLPVSSTCHL